MIGSLPKPMTKDKESRRITWTVEAATLTNECQRSWGSSKITAFLALSSSLPILSYTISSVLSNSLLRASVFSKAITNTKCEKIASFPPRQLAVSERELDKSVDLSLCARNKGPPVLTKLKKPCHA